MLSGILESKWILCWWNEIMLLNISFFHVFPAWYFYDYQYKNVLPPWILDFYGLSLHTKRLHIIYKSCAFHSTYNVSNLWYKLCAFLRIFWFENKLFLLNLVGRFLSLRVISGKLEMLTMVYEMQDLPNDVKIRSNYDAD